jgi:hypothetical protein
VQLRRRGPKLLVSDIGHPLILRPAVPVARGEVNELSHDLKAAAASVLAEVTKLYLRVLPLVDGGTRALGEGRPGLVQEAARHQSRSRIDGA